MVEIRSAASPLLAPTQPQIDRVVRLHHFLEQTPTDRLLTNPRMLETVNLFLALINPVRITTKTLPIDQPPYHVRASEKGEREYVRRVWKKGKDRNQHHHYLKPEKKETLPRFYLRVTLDPKRFNLVTDLPGLNYAIEQAHNQKMVEYQVDQPINYLDTNRYLGHYWQFISQKMTEYLATKRTVLQAEHQAGTKLDAMLDFSSQLARVSISTQCLKSQLFTRLFNYLKKLRTVFTANLAGNNPGVSPLLSRLEHGIISGKKLSKV